MRENSFCGAEQHQHVALCVTLRYVCLLRQKKFLSAISQLLLVRFWPNFKDKFLGLSLTDPNYHGDICPGNICPGDICPYQQYLSCYWSDFDQILKVGSWDLFEHISTFKMTFVQATFVLATFVHIRNISAVTNLILTKL